MREDQIQRLNDLGEKLADAVLRDADPENWIAGDKVPREMTTQERGDAHWCRKIAAGSYMLLERTLSLVERVKNPGRENDSGTSQADLDLEIAAAEKRAAQVLDQTLARARKVMFDRKVHGAK
jgi:hypothetical protein